VEVAASSASYDLHDKLALYRQMGVPEYIVWQTEDARITWFRLHGGRYTQIASDEHGIIESEVFPGLRFNVPAMLAGDRNRVLDTPAEH
jgi:Uma2 family endonuclease